jgi:hypothetical protein
LPAPIVAKDEFIKVNLELIAAHAVILGRKGKAVFADLPVNEFSKKRFGI